MNSAVVSRSSLKLKAYTELLKLRLSLLVVFSGGVGYYLALDKPWVLSEFLLFSLAGLLITGAANTFNQLIEKNSDALMSRTSGRPLPSGRLSANEVFAFGLITALTGFGLMVYFFPPVAAALALLSFALYVFAYTPLKKTTPYSVAVGAVPGALPPLIGWAAASGSVDMHGLILFGIQFIWQFPHFWAIAWVLDEDYKKAGFKMLPGSGEKDIRTAFQIMIYALFLIPLGLLPVRFGMAGINSAVVITVCGVLFLAQTFWLMKEGSRKAALRIMFGSFLYLPIVQIALIVDKV